jgi:hypothetical protein
MLSWFAPKSPVSESQRAWLDQRIDWLVEEFGAARLDALPMVLPTTEFFPDSFHNREADVEPMLRRICRQMAIDLERIDLYFYDQKPPELGSGVVLKGGSKGAAGLYHAGSRQRIGIERGQLADPMSLVATLAHELGHVLLLGEDRIERNADDHEPLTDLLTVLFGYGIFSANACVRDGAWSAGGWQGWSVGRQGYLSQGSWSYALARYALRRNDPKPKWGRHLRADIRSGMKNAILTITRERH